MKPLALHALVIYLLFVLATAAFPANDPHQLFGQSSKNITSVQRRDNANVNLEFQRLYDNYRDDYDAHFQDSHPQRPSFVANCTHRGILFPPHNGWTTFALYPPPPNDDIDDPFPPHNIVAMAYLTHPVLVGDYTIWKNAGLSYRRDHMETVQVVETQVTDGFDLMATANVHHDLVPRYQEAHPQYSSMQHFPFIVRIHTFFVAIQHGESQYIVQEPVLETIDQIQEPLHNRQHVMENVVETVFAQMLVAVQAVHDQGYAHNAIVPQSFFVTEWGNGDNGKMRSPVVKLGGFEAVTNEPVGNEPREYGDDMWTEPYFGRGNERPKPKLQSQF